MDWDPSQCYLKVGAIPVTELDEFDAKPGDELSPIESATDGVTGFNESHQKPTWNAKVKISSQYLQELDDYKNDKTEVSVTFVAPGYTCTLTGARISKVDPSGGDLKTGWTVSIEGFAKKLRRHYG